MRGFKSGLRSGIATRGNSKATSTPSVPIDTYFPNTILFLSGNGVDNSIEIRDSSLYLRSISVFGNSAIDVAQSLDGYGCIRFDGFGDYLTVPYSSDFNLSGEFKIETRFKVNSFSSNQCLISKDTYGVNWDWGIEVLGNSSIRCYTNKGFNSLQVSVPSLSTNTWYKIVLERKLLSGTLTNTIYLNDVAYGANTMAITNDSQAWITVGCQSHNNPSSFFNGWLEDLIVART